LRVIVTILSAQEYSTKFCSSVSTASSRKAASGGQLAGERGAVNASPRGVGRVRISGRIFLHSLEAVERPLQRARCTHRLVRVPSARPAATSIKPCWRPWLSRTGSGTRGCPRRKRRRRQPPAVFAASPRSCRHSLVVHEAQPFANTELPAPPGDSFEKSPGVVNGRRSEQVSRDDRLAPAAITVIAAAAEQKHNHKDDQQEFHNFLQNLNLRTSIECRAGVTITVGSEDT